MRVLIDTNILISALLFPNSKPAKALLHVSEHHDMVLCDQNIVELKEVLKRKAPMLMNEAEVLLQELSYELIPSVKHLSRKMRDVKDQPILNSAIKYKVDIILTGDKDFLALRLKRPMCMTVSTYLESLSDL